MRHGATEWNRTKRAQGTADIALNREGRKQAEAIAALLADEDVRAVYSSDLARSIDTAKVVAATHGLQAEIDPDFREIDQGEWTGLPVAEIRRRWPDLWGPARHYSARPGGESPAQVRERALRGLERVVKAHPEGTVVVVSHGGTIRWLSAAALKYDDHRSARIRGLGNGQMVSIQAHTEDGRLVIDRFVRMDGNTPDLDDPND